jgi:mRNA-degrading endonuclease RelE of RelBE toxin-antitoxin system
MAEYSITFARSARKEFEALDAEIVNRIFPKIERLSRCPRPKNSVKLRGGGNLWRIRIGAYRLFMQSMTTKS